jgi:hypothetical protein
MDKRMIIFSIAVLILTFIVGFRSSYMSGIQPGYFEKAEAPAYGVGGGELLGADMGEEFQKHLETLYEGLSDDE